jgi:hypothetical protein
MVCCPNQESGLHCVALFVSGGTCIVVLTLRVGIAIKDVGELEMMVEIQLRQGNYSSVAGQNRFSAFDRIYGVCGLETYDQVTIPERRAWLVLWIQRTWKSVMSWFEMQQQMIGYHLEYRRDRCSRRLAPS